MKTGTYISGAGHLALILFVLFGGLLEWNEEADFSVADVSILSEEEFAALNAPPPAPDAAEDVAPPPAAPDQSPTPPARPAPDAQPETPETPEAEAPAPPEETPDVSEIEPLPEQQVTPDAPITPEPPSEEGTTLTAPTPEPDSPAPAPRVAPDAAPAPDPEAEIAESVQDAVTPDEPTETPQEEQDATAPEEAATEIVTEAEESEEPAVSAPLASRRPPPRPERTQPAETQTAAVSAPEEPAAETPAPEAPADDPLAGAIGDALAEAAETAETEAPATPSDTPAPSGPPLTRGDREGLRLAVQDCWVVDVGSEAANVTVVVGMSMNQDGSVVDGSLRLLSSDGGAGRAAEVAFQAARRAILRCEKGGYDLPAEKFGQWQDIEITFNPKNMRTR